MWFGGNQRRWKDGNDMAKFQRKGKKASQFGKGDAKSEKGKPFSLRSGTCITFKTLPYF
jgi:hypothetical protein